MRHVLLEVRRSNAPAIALYRALGFFAMGVRARYYPDDEDAVEMVLAFDSGDRGDRPARRRGPPRRLRRRAQPRTGARSGGTPQGR